MDSSSRIQPHESFPGLDFRKFMDSLGGPYLNQPTEPEPTTVYDFKSHGMAIRYTTTEPQNVVSIHLKPDELVPLLIQPRASEFDIKEKQRRKLFTSESDEDVLEILYQNNMKECVDDYLSYTEWRLNNLEDGEQPSIILHSLQSWAWFLIDCARAINLPYANLTADFDGCVELEWELSGKTQKGERSDQYWGPSEGIAMLRFYPSRMHAFSILSGSYASGKRRITFESCLPYRELKKILPLFAERFLDDNY